MTPEGRCGTINSDSLYTSCNAKIGRYVIVRHGDDMMITICEAEVMGRVIQAGEGCVTDGLQRHVCSDNSDGTAACAACTAQIGCRIDGAMCSVVTSLEDKLICAPAGGAAGYYVDAAGTVVQCGAHGRCRNGGCVCSDGHTGNHCETAPNLCLWPTPIDCE